jgi:hypothetical protein
MEQANDHMENTTQRRGSTEKDKQTSVKGAGHRMREAVGEHAQQNHVHGQGASKMGADTHTQQRQDEIPEKVK